MKRWVFGWVFGLSSAAWAATPLPPLLDEGALKDGRDGKVAIHPCQDFYQFACGGWIEKTEIPADQPMIYRQSAGWVDETQRLLNSILQRCEAQDPSISARAQAQLGDYYSTCMNSEQTVSTSVEALRIELKEIDQINNKRDLARSLARVLARLHSIGTDALFSFSSGQDPADSRRVIGILAQGGMGLAEPDDYFPTDSKSVEIRERYQKHMARIFELLGEPPTVASQIAIRVLKFESELASQADHRVERFDPSKTHHPIDLAGLKKVVPALDWELYFSDLGVNPHSAFNLSEPEFMAHLNLLLNQTPLSDLKNYLSWQLALRSARMLNSDWEKEHFQFWNAFLKGTEAMAPRWKRCTELVENRLGYALAEAYVSTMDTGSVIHRVEMMIQKIKQAFADRLGELIQGPEAWMDSATGKMALLKLSLMGQKIGAPEKWRDYSTLNLGRSSFLLNDFKAARFEVLRNLEKIGKPVDHSEWEMMPWEMNAYYDPSNNEFVFPFGILQPPSLELQASDGANLGSLGGGTIGHELTHGYDNDGSQYDGYGNVKNWWTAETKKKFEERAHCFIDQANAYKIEEVGLNVPGESTLTENLSDQGGVRLGYAALISLQAQRPEAPLWLGKYTERQQYWIAYAQSWCAKSRPESLREALNSNEHPPAEFRVNGVLMNRPEFARDFSCAENDRMSPRDRCSLW